MRRWGTGDLPLRAGLHCAPVAHRTAGTLETGTVRASVSAFNTDDGDRPLSAGNWRDSQTLNHEKNALKWYSSH